MPDPQFRLYDRVGELDSREFQISLANNPSADHGLRFTKFFGRWQGVAGGLLKTIDIPGDQGATRTENTSPTLDWLDPAALSSNPPSCRKPGKNPTLVVGDKARLDEACNRLSALATASTNVVLVSRLLIGTGLPHPTENGFTFHPTLAVPYLRGSGLKALARAAAEDDGICQTKVDRLLGAVDQGGTASILDGLPLQPLTLTGEQITNHYPGYYGGPDPALGEARSDMDRPADWYDPVPITLLAVDASLAKPARFRIGVRAGNRADADAVLRWLVDGLDRYGFGAKTATGFGWLMTEERLTALKVENAARSAAQTALATQAKAQAEAAARVRPLTVGEYVSFGGMTFRIDRLEADQVWLFDPDEGDTVQERFDPVAMRRTPRPR